MAETQPPVVLASGSAARRKLLSAAGVPFTVQPAEVDEAALRAGMANEHEGELTPEDVAVELACEKAKAVSRLNRRALVIGADQVLSCGNDIFGKAPDAAAARQELRALRGQTHVLTSAFALARDGNVICYHAAAARLTMRMFSDAFLDEYLERAGDAILSCVGCYELEGLGLQLFEKVDGDYFTILGLPMMALLTELRARGALMT